MSNSGANRATWSNLIKDKKADFIQQGCELPSAVKNEDSFCKHFEALCKANNYFFYTRLLPKVRYDRIIAFADAVDELVGHVPPENLSGTVSGGAFVAVKALCEAGIPLQRIAEQLGLLNSKVPQLGLEIRRFPYDFALQEPLQEIFAAYMDALLCMVRDTKFQLRPLDSTLNQSNENDMKESAAKFQGEEARFKRLLAQAMQSEAAQSNSNSPSQTSSSDGKHYRYNDTSFRFRPVKKLGYGASAEVTMVEEVSTRELCARKQFFLKANGYNPAIREEEVKNEYDIMKKLTHLHIAKVLWWGKDKDQDACSIYMEPAADCNLRSYLEQCIADGFPQSARQQILPWFGCLLDALSHAHKQNILHRDIKPRNILIKDQRVYLADFGLAKDFTSTGTSQIPSDLICGTPVYHAPEVGKDNAGKYNAGGRSADDFALGCVFSEMLTVYSGRSLEEYQEYRKVVEARNSEGGMLAFRANLPRVIQWLKQLEQDSGPDPSTRILVWQITGMLQEDPQRRSESHAGKQFLISQKVPKLFCGLHD